MKHLLLPFAFLSTFCLTAQTTYYVQQDSSGTTGLSWADAFGDLQQAIDSTLAGDEIWVAEGEYRPTHDNPESSDNTSRDVTFHIAEDIKIYGGFAGGETSLFERDWEANETLLSGDIGVSTDSTDNCYHIMFIGSNSGPISRSCTIDGFVFRYGNADGSGYEEQGGAIFNFGEDIPCSPTIQHCVFQNNYAKEGGAIYNNGRGGSGDASPLIRKCQFEENDAEDGGAIYNYGFAGHSNPEIILCAFIRNEASLGGVFFHDATGFGECLPKVINSIFCLNTGTFGGVFFNDGSDDGTMHIPIIHCSFNGNSSGSGKIIYQNDGAATIVNSILWNGSALVSNFGSSSTMVDYSIVSDNSLISTLNTFNVDPNFVDEANCDLRVMTPSMAIGAGDETMIKTPIDLDGKARLLDLIDMGAYEQGDPCFQFTKFLQPNDFLAGDSEVFLTDQTIIARNRILKNAEISFDAGQGVGLSEGFEVEAGAVFLAETEGCN